MSEVPASQAKIPEPIPPVQHPELLKFFISNFSITTS